MNSISSGSYASVAGNYAYTGYGTSGTGDYVKIRLS